MGQCSTYNFIPSASSTSLCTIYSGCWKGTGLKYSFSTSIQQDNVEKSSENYPLNVSSFLCSNHQIRIVVYMLKSLRWAVRGLNARKATAEAFGLVIHSQNEDTVTSGGRYGTVAVLHVMCKYQIMPTAHSADVYHHASTQTPRPKWPIHLTYIG